MNLLKLKKNFDWFYNLPRLIFLKSLGLNAPWTVTIYKSTWPLQKLKSIRIGDNAVICPNTKIWLGPEGKLYIGENTSIGINNRIVVSGDMSIQSNVLISENVFISDSEHPYDEKTGYINTGIELRQNVLIGPRCFIGINSVILPGTFLNADCVVGANTVVNRYFEEGDVIVGQIGRNIL